MIPLIKTVRLAHEFILDSLFPKRCLSCHSQYCWLCSDCKTKIAKSRTHFCPQCEKRPTPNGETCFECFKKSPLSGLFVTASYKDPLIKLLVHHAKYSYIQEISSLLGDIVGTALTESDIPIPDCIIPIPLHRRRLRWRGFNQSAVMTQSISLQLAPELGIPIITDVLMKTRNNHPQMSIRSYQQRLLNVKDTYKISDSTPISNKRILLVDDIATTGATIFECARLLKENGAREVWGAVVARQEFGNKKS